MAMQSFVFDEGLVYTNGSQRSFPLAGCIFGPITWCHKHLFSEMVVYQYPYNSAMIDLWVSWCPYVRLL